MTADKSTVALTSEDDVEHLVRVLPQSTTTRKERLEDLFANDTAPSAIDVFRTWFGPANTPSLDDARRYADVDVAAGFDPKTDSRQSTHLILIGEAYDRAIEEGLDDVAVYLRALEEDQQRKFARLLRRGVLE
ncbi:hypothetical protein [Halarchaeum nitratireducens]|uniref:Uncharacterized protein n=1 Tax=Halarchaeum nitratireducens TaxID=489913 RepID=A0A830GHN4_9EURY|nr:hypothetical protein [Halarchaeum nitratireducens]GGN26937.1 hypothetical protein GCM10009021_31790 [Halarchaeum nitratireducens]